VAPPQQGHAAAPAARGARAADSPATAVAPLAFECLHLDCSSDRYGCSKLGLRLRLICILFQIGELKLKLLQDRAEEALAQRTIPAPRQSVGIDPHLRVKVIALGERLPEIWADPATRREHRKVLLRCLIDKPGVSIKVIEQISLPTTLIDNSRAQTRRSSRSCFGCSARHSVKSTPTNISCQATIT
jgi:hypothetical protein